MQIDNSGVWIDLAFFLGIVFGGLVMLYFAKVKKLSLDPKCTCGADKRPYHNFEPYHYFWCDMNWGPWSRCRKKQFGFFYPTKAAKPPRRIYKR